MTSGIPLYGSELETVRQHGLGLCAILQDKFGCKASITGVDFKNELTSAQQKKPTVVPENRYTIRLPSGVKVSVWKADLTTFSVDAVVNAANVDLQHCGGLALALSQAGGFQIQKESSDYVKSHGPLKTGDAVVGEPGMLQTCKKIIHAVGPQLPMHPSNTDVAQAKPLLEKAINSIFDRVQENNLKSVAIPAISSGLFHFPLQECANTIVSTVKQYCGYSNRVSIWGHFPDEIFLVNHDEPSVKEMNRACCVILGPSEHAYSQAAAVRNSTPNVQLGKILLTLKWGKIEEQKADVIVNTISTSRDLGSGQISKAISQKAGKQMQQEIHRARKDGHVVVTKGFNLQCQTVYHTICSNLTSAAAKQILYQSVQQCIKMAGSSHYQSIAFPAIGTGGLGFSKSESAQIMTEAVAFFDQKTQVPSKVDFVIFPGDSDTFKAFEKQIIAHQHMPQQNMHPSRFGPAPEQDEDFQGKKHSSPQIRLESPSREAVREAKRWFSELFKSSVTIHNNFIQHFSEQEYQQLFNLTKNGISIEESFDRGHAAITVSGKSSVDVAVAALQVEAMLCNVQRQFVADEEEYLFRMLTKPASSMRKTVDHSVPGKLSEFQMQGLRLCKLEKVENARLEIALELKKKQLRCFNTQKMFQRIPAQFCAMISRIGFHSEIAPPADLNYGEGIYFAGNVGKAMDVWKQPKEEYVYLVEADVLTGKSTAGAPGLILPPAVGKDPHVVYDSVHGGSDISVIFSGYQALPRYIITCERI